MNVITTLFKTTLISSVLLTYSFIESTNLVVTRFPIIVSIIHLSLMGWPLLSVVSKKYQYSRIRLKGTLMTFQMNVLYVKLFG